MKKYTLTLVTLLLPLMAKAELTSTLKNLEEVRMSSGVCGMSDVEFEKIQKSFIKINNFDKQGSATATLAMKDLNLARAQCAEKKIEELKSEVLGYEPKFPMEIMNSFTTGDEEKRQNVLALDFVKSKDDGSCEKIELKDIYNNEVWHRVFLEKGWPCTAKNYIELSQELNAKNGFTDAQKFLDDLKSMKLPELKKLFKKTYKNGIDGEPLKIALVPHLSWENGTLNTKLPYKFFLRKTELTTYDYLVKEFKKLGVRSVFIQRNSLNPLENQVAETKSKLLALKGKHLVISRSMGARVMREIIAQNDPEVNSKIGAYLNIGGTPHGSVIAKAKVHPDNFYRGLVPSVTGIFNLPLNIILKDPRLPKHLLQTLYSSLDRNNLATMMPIQAREITESPVKALNTVFVRTDYERAAPLIDPVWMHMLQQGPTEGSSPLAGAGVDTKESIRLVMDSDHLGFWKYTPTEAMEIYLRILIAANQVGLVK